MVHCSHLNERLEFGMESVSLLAHSFINNRGKIIPCRTAIVDLGLNEVDPGLAPDGAKCGEGMVGRFIANHSRPKNLKESIYSNACIVLDVR